MIMKSKDGMPFVSVEELERRLEPTRTLWESESAHEAELQWATTSEWVTDSFEESSIAILCSAKDAKGVAQRFGRAFLVINGIPSEAQTPDGSRAFIVIEEAAPADLLGRLQDFFLSRLTAAAQKERASEHNLPAKSVAALFRDLIQQNYLSSSELSEYCSLYHLSPDSELRLLSFSPAYNPDGDSHRKLIEAAHGLNRGKCLVSSREGVVLALLHSNDFDDRLSTISIENQLHQIMVPYGGFVAASQVFTNILNFHFAFQQTQLISSYKEHLDLSLEFSSAHPDESKLCYTFEEILTFALVDSDAMTKEMQDFAFSHTILEKIIAEDATKGGEDARILASYLSNERKATVVADELHMHRNTVLYRIGKIEKRFGLDLDEKWSRDRVTFDLAILYCRLMKDAELRSKLLGR